MATLSTPEPPYDVAPLDGAPGGMPLVVHAVGDRDPGRLAGWLRAERGWVRERLAEHGAILFRGFAVHDATTFERVARAIDDDLQNEYLGTSPRNALTSHVFTASELPPYFPIPQHCEMSFTAHPPRRLFFCCLVEPADGSGETPLTDFRRVLRDLDPDLVARLERKGLRIVRNYSGPAGGSALDPFRLKRWDEMFLTTDRQAVEARCRAEGFEPVWVGDDGLRIVSTQPVTRVHPETGEAAWHNHLTTFHVAAPAAEYARIHARRPSPRSWLFLQLTRALTTLQRWTRASDELSMHCTHLDGTEIPDADVAAVLDAVWKNLVVFSWRRGDVVAIDNFSVAHGRLPYEGPREVAVAWA